MTAEEIDLFNALRQHLRESVPPATMNRAACVNVLIAMWVLKDQQGIREIVWRIEKHHEWLAFMEPMPTEECQIVMSTLVGLGLAEEIPQSWKRSPDYVLAKTIADSCNEIKWEFGVV